MSSPAVIKLQIPKRRHFELIGKGGQTVKQLQTDYNVKIDIPGREENSNEVAISGKKEDVERLRKRIDEMLGIATSTQPLISWKLDIATEHHGTLIGKGGSNLRDLEKKFSVSINVPRRDADSKDSYVIVEGEEAHLQEALEEINALLKTEVAVVKEKPQQKQGKPSTPPKESTAKVAVKVKETTTVTTTINNSNNNSSPSLSNPKPAWGKPEKAQTTVTETTTVTAAYVPSPVDHGSSINKVIFFPDKGGSTQNIHAFINYLSSAHSTLDVCVFTITYDLIANVILHAHSKGVKVRVITDDDTSTQLGSDIQKFMDAGISVKMDHSPFHMHHKFAILDGKLLLNGSFNWTRQASTTNCENVMITTNKEFVSEFEKHFESMWNDHEHFH